MPIKLTRDKAVGLKNKFRLATVLLLVVFAVLVLVSFRKKGETTADYIPSLLRLSKVTRIYDIAHDPYRNGFLWLATDAGIIGIDRFKGSSRYYGLQDGLTTETISALLPLKNGILAATWDGLVLLDPDSGKVKQYVSAQKGFASERYFSLARSGTEIFAGGDRGIDIMDETLSLKRVLTRGDGIFRREVYAVKVFDNKLIAGHDEGVVSVLDLKTMNSKSLPVPLIAGKKTVITDMLPEKERVMFATTDAGIWEWDWQKDSMVVYSPSTGFPAKGAYTIRRIDGEIWCGTAFGIVRSLSENGPWLIMRNDEETEDGLFPVTALENDGDGVWYGLIDMGLGRFSKQRIEWVSIFTGFTYDVVKTVGFMDNAMWIGFGYLGNGVDLVDINTNTFLANRGLGNRMVPERVTKIIEDEKFGYVCGYEGIRIRNLQNGEEEAIVMEQDGVRMSDVTSASRIGHDLWVGTLAGLRLYNLNSKKVFDKSDCISDGITDIIARDERLFASTLRSGIIEISAATGSSVDTAYAKSRVDAFAICGDSIWAQLFNEGLAVTSFEKNAEYSIEKRDGLDSINVSTLAFVDNHLWIGTKKHGIKILDVKKNNMRSIDYRHGLINNEILCIRPHGRNIWVGHSGGLTGYERDSVYNALWN